MQNEHDSSRSGRSIMLAPTWRRPIQYLSVCSGIEAATVAWHPLGFQPVGFAEVEAFPSAVLAHHYPDTPNFGDLNAFREWPHLTPDVLVGGTPCQSFSVAGLRQGLADPRGNLALTYLAVAERYRPRWVVWENVPGVLSSNGGRDFGSFLGALAELGYGWAYRVLDAQYFGVPQRRRRVFVVGCAGNWRRAAAVLFERESLRGDPPPSRETGQVAPTTPARSTGGGGEPAAAGRTGTDFDLDGGLIPSTGDVAHCLNAGGMGRIDYETETMIAFNSREDPVSGPVPGALGTSSPQAQAVAYDMRGREGGAQMEGPHDTANIRASSGGSSRSYVIQERAVSESPDAGPDGAPNVVAPPLSADADKGDRDTLVAPIDLRQASRGEKVTNTRRRGSGGPPGHGIGEPGAPAFTVSERGQAVAFKSSHYTRGKDGAPSPVVPPLSAGAGKGDHDPLVHANMQVRRLTPTECERLQGFPDGYTQVPYRNKPASDGPRYKALGNSMAVPVMRWIGRRLQIVDGIDE